MLFSLLKHYLDTDTALKVPHSVYCFTTSISHRVENYFPRLWGTGISDAIFIFTSATVYVTDSFLYLNVDFFLLISHAKMMDLYYPTLYYYITHF